MRRLMARYLKLGETPDTRSDEVHVYQFAHAEDIFPTVDGLLAYARTLPGRYHVRHVKRYLRPRRRDIVLLATNLQFWGWARVKTPLVEERYVDDDGTFDGWMELEAFHEFTRP